MLVIEEYSEILVGVGIGLGSSFASNWLHDLFKN